jgi:hypothetical protein
MRDRYTDTAIRNNECNHRTLLSEHCQYCSQRAWNEAHPASNLPNVGYNWQRRNDDFYAFSGSGR